MRYRAKTICCSFSISHSHVSLHSFISSFNIFIFYFYFVVFAVMSSRGTFCLSVLFFPKQTPVAHRKWISTELRKHCCLLHKYIYSIKNHLLRGTKLYFWYCLTVTFIGGFACFWEFKVPPIGFILRDFCTFELDWDTPGDKGLIWEHGEFEILADEDVTKVLCWTD